MLFCEFWPSSQKRKSCMQNCITCTIQYMYYPSPLKKKLQTKFINGHKLFLKIMFVVKFCDAVFKRKKKFLGENRFNVYITKTCPCNILRFFSFRIFQLKNFDIFLIFAQNIDCGYTVEPPRQGGSNEYPQSMFWSKNKKNRYTPAYPSFAI